MFGYILDFVVSIYTVILCRLHRIFCGLPDKQKSPDFSVETALLFSSTIIKQWFQPFGLHTHCLTNSFVCNFLSSSAGFNLCSCFFRLTLAFWLSLSGFSGPSIPRPGAASFPLSDPRCFRVLSSASVLGSDYSASVSSFPSLPASASQWIAQCSGSAFASSVFPVLPRLVSRALRPGSGTWLSVRFLSSFPASLPQLFHRCFPSFPLPRVRIFPGLFCLPSGFFRPLPPASDYSAFCSFFSPLPDLPWQRFSRCAPVSCVPFAILFRRACFHAFHPTPVLSFLLILSPAAVSPHSGYLSVSAFRLLFRPRPPGFRFRFRLLSLSVLNFSAPHRTRIYYHCNRKMSTPFLYIFQLLSCALFS